MNVYLVGGAVRDELLGRPVVERDWVVVGSTPEAMAAQGYRQVGRDFPVFLHPDSGEEYALARTERKTGPGHTGFVCHAGPDVTLEEDLRRRDLTVNAMARTADGTLVDPFGGRDDLRTRLLRHVSEAFAEDPLRVFRVARFAAQLPGFQVAPETLRLMRAMARRGELAELAAQRVWQELHKALGAAAPARFFDVLEEADARAPWLPELPVAVPSSVLELDTPEGRLAALCWSLDTARVTTLCERLKVPRRFQRLAECAAAFGPLLAGWHDASPDVVLEALQNAGTLAPQRDPEPLLRVIEVRGGRPLNDLRALLGELRAVVAAPFIDRGLAGKAIGEAIRTTRLGLVTAARRSRPPA